ncbi:MAG TPA: hypothetical protein VKZ59_03905 [Acidobacteriota bacterium]|nr:hypothetical protein [Acidobacteriota bacterium]
MKMKKLKYQVRFLTPAFLGNAEQSEPEESGSENDIVERLSYV